MVAEGGIVMMRRGALLGAKIKTPSELRLLCMRILDG